MHKLPDIDNRQSASARGYDNEWKQIRDKWLRSHPWCANPYNYHITGRVQAVLVDHITPKRDGGSNNESNLQSLCLKCHARKTSRDNKKGRG